ncbi:hypothetical protein [Methylobacterium sp. Leaf100]|uniref:hypothetical protein n=1 Tax=Methylobacterium sp. Leaf100 TaxID=1736252 RepID=UPI001AEBCBD2|nr:hypothetical protein [Methylobacterium sp. Leaf100]
MRKLKDTRLVGAKLPGGLFDPDKAKALYSANVDRAMQRERPGAQTAVAAHASDAEPSASMPAPAAAGPDVTKARAFWTFEKAKREQIKRKKDEASSIERAPTLALVTTLARAFRDGLFGFIDRHYAEMAAELGVDPHVLYEVLTRYLRRYVETSIDRIKVALK